MDAQGRAALEKESQDLRLELKEWETTWAKNHNGRKPGRDNIKQHPEIGKEQRHP